MDKYIGYAWIKVSRYEMDPNKSWEERYKALERHHIMETNFLINEVRNLAVKLGSDKLPIDREEERLPSECCYG